jgi:tetratricopeptide (TPR) repeat protein
MTDRFSRLRFAAVCLTLVLCRSLVSQTPYSSEIDGLVRRCMDYNFACRFDSALACARTIEETLPDESIGYVCGAGVLQSMMIEYATDQWEKEFYGSIDQAVRKGESRIRKKQDLSWNRYCLGSVYLYKGLYRGKTGDLVSGVIHAHRGVKLLEKAYSADSTLYDALVGIGSYKYWAGRFYQHLSWLPWIGDERDLGVQMVEKAIHQGMFSYYAGLNSLGWIEFDRNHCESGLSLFRKGLEKYPDSRLFLWGEADCLFRLNRMKEAAAVYEKLLASIIGDRISNSVNEILSCTESALIQSNAVLLMKIDPKTAKKTEKQRQTALEIRNRCADKD